MREARQKLTNKFPTGIFLIFKIDPKMWVINSSTPSISSQMTSTTNSTQIHLKINLNTINSLDIGKESPRRILILKKNID